MPYRYNPAFNPQAEPVDADAPELLAQYSRRTLLVANAAGILPTLKTLAALNADARKRGPADLAAELAILKQRQVVMGRLLVLSSTINSIAAELDCEGERADQLAASLARLDETRTQRLNVASIVIGAMSGIGTTVSGSRHTQLAFGVGGGALGAGLGILSLQTTATRDFEHARNLLTDIWLEAPNSSVWPPSVWYMLSTAAFSNEGRTSIAHNSRQRWLGYEQLAQPESAQSRRLVALLFGSGGEYSAENLALRANMLNELQSAVRLLNQELQRLLLEFNDE